MRKSKINIPTPVTTAEMFFIEKSFELLSEETIDTYRLRLHNPKTILSELAYLIKSFHDNNIAEDYAKAACEEAKDLINLDKELKFVGIDRNYFNSLLGNNKDLNKIFYAINIILNENENYLETLFDAIQSEIVRLNAKGAIYPSDLKRMNYLISFLFVELRKKGFNKIYLHRTIRAIFSGSIHGDAFSDRFSIIRAIAGRAKEKFTAYYVFEINTYCRKYVDNNPIRLKYHKKSDLKSLATMIGNAHFEDFISEVEEGYIYSREIFAIDYYSASIEARKIIQQCLDFCFLGNEEHIINVSDKCFIMGSESPEKSKSQNLTYKLDGDLKGSYQTFKIFTKKMASLNDRKIDNSSIDKIKSGLRYLRLGNQDSSPEQKLINYWIAIEYIFSSYEGNGNKTTRLKEFFKKIHGYSYARRLFMDMHQSIQNFKLSAILSLYDVTNPKYLTEDVTETELLAIIDQHPLINYRLYSLRERFKEAKSINSELKRHMNNLERNIMRIYRVRNQIVHNAASDISKDDIFELATHLKYYLIFTINGLLDFLLDHPVDVDNNKGIGIDDYFHVKSLKLESLLFNTSLTNIQLIALNSPIEFLKK